MWLTAVLTIIVSLIGYASMTSQAALQRAEAASRATSLAQNLASYRTGVIASANDAPHFTGEITPGFFPTGHVQLDPPLWRNYVLSDGTILLYASTPQVGLVSEIENQALHSALAGRFNAATGRIDATGILPEDRASLALPASLALADGTLVWLAHRE